MDSGGEAADVLGALQDVIGCALLHGGDGDFFGPRPGDDDHRNARVEGADGVEHLEAVEAQDVEVAQHEVVLAGDELCLELGAAGGRDHLEAAGLAFQRVSHQFAVVRVVVNMQDAHESGHQPAPR
ncbi:MAG: hypothetical protein NTW87_35065 [Planctomycetota bacterium]|nr:hypothetical protein [Planctomycetota bacterium]